MDQSNVRDARSPGRPVVGLRVPAQPAYLTSLRTLACGLAERQGFTLDDIGDLRLAVGESASLAVEHAATDADLLAQFTAAPGRLTVTLTTTTAGPIEPDYDTFAWQVIETMAHSAAAHVEGLTYSVTLTFTSSIADAGS